jgi:hypothetical protein
MPAAVRLKKLYGAPETIRTSDLALRRRLLYPAELPGQTFESGGAEEDRTPDLCIANAALSQLSYGPFAESEVVLCRVILTSGLEGVPDTERELQGGMIGEL